MLFDRLKAFHAVINNGGFERATQSIHLSQPPISSGFGSSRNNWALNSSADRGERLD